MINVLLRFKLKEVHRLGIKPGTPAWQTSILPLILKIFIIAVKENMIDIFYFGPLILKTVELCLKKVSACYRDRDLFNMAKMTAKHQKLCDPL